MIRRFLIGVVVGLLAVLFSRFELDEIQTGITNIIQNNETIGFAFIVVLLVFIVPSFSKFLARNNRFKDEQ